MAGLLKGSLEENILSCICWVDRCASEFALQLTPELFSTRPYRKIAAQAFAFIEKYSRPPKGHIADLLEKDLKRGDEGRLLGETLESMQAIHADLNVDFIREKLDHFIAVRKMSVAVEEAADALAEEDIAKAQDALYKRNLHVKQSPGIYLSDAKSMLSFMDKAEDEFFSSGVQMLDARGIRPGRGQQFVPMAPSGTGKSWWCIAIALGGIQHRKKVLHVTLELSEEQLAPRYVQALFAMSTSEMTSVRVPVFTRDEHNYCTGFDFHNYTPDVIDEKRRSIIAKKLERFSRRSPLLIKEFPTGSLTLGQLNSYLDFLENSSDFKPDILIVDYPDLMAIDASNQRIDIGRVFRGLRGIAMARNIALVTPTQSNRESLDAKVITAKHIAEDFSKVMTADSLITFNQTKREKDLNLARLFVTKGRSAADKFQVLISQSYATGQFCIDSVMMNNQMELEIGRMTGEPSIPAEKRDD